MAGIFHSNRFQYINLYFPDTKEKNLFISKLQSVDTTASILGPVVAGLVITFLPMNISFLIDSFIYLVTAIFWMVQKRVVIPNQKEMKLLEGYHVIGKMKSLRDMILARIIGGIPMVVWSALLPLLLIKYLDKNLFSSSQGMALTVMSLGVFLTNIFLPKIKHGSMETIEKNYLSLSVLPLTIGFFIIGLGNHLEFIDLVSLCIVSLFLGISVACFRTGGIILGQKITSVRSLHLVIGSSDSIVRLMTGLLTVIYGFSMGRSIDDKDIILSCLVAVCTAAFAQIIYLRLCNTFDSQKKVLEE